MGTHDPGCPALLRCELLWHHSLPPARPETSTARVLPRRTVSAHTHHIPTWHTLGSSLWTVYGTPKGECVNTSVTQRAIVNHPKIQSSSSSSSKLLANSALHDYLSSAHINSPPCLMIWVDLQTFFTRCRQITSRGSEQRYLGHHTLPSWAAQWASPPWSQCLCSADYCRTNNGKSFWNAMKVCTEGYKFQGTGVLNCQSKQLG